LPFVLDNDYSLPAGQAWLCQPTALAAGTKA
jgi:hypothetical protein